MGCPSRAALLYRLEDKRIQSFFLAGRYPHLHEMRAVVEGFRKPAFGEADPPPSAKDDSGLGEGTAASGAGEADPPSATEGDSKLKEGAGGVKVGKRRTQVILHLLHEGGVLKRTRTGYKLAGDLPTDDTLEALLKTYVDRATRDKERLAEMMHYAETPNCRTQVIRAYFGEPEGEPCGRCDNCARAQQEETQSEVGQAPEQLEVTVIPTMHGEIHTTAPETLVAASPSPAFAAGDGVRHRRFGQGKVLDCLNDMVLVDFVKGGSRRVRADFLERAA